MNTTTQKKQTTSVMNDGQTFTQVPAVTPAQTSGRLTADDIKGLYGQMQEQANKQVDYSVQQGIADLERAQQDAQKKFLEQQRQVNIEEAQARDRHVLYAAARGDRGGITARQYDSISNAAANNRQAIRAQQQQLATDTARQIADLRAKGEFEKANSVLQIAQQQLAQLWELQQYEDQQAQIQKEWDYQVQQDKQAQENYLKELLYQQAQDQLKQQNYQKEWEYQVQQDKLAQENYQKEWDYQVGQDEYNKGQAEREWAYEIAMQAIKTGVVPPASVLTAAGIDSKTASAMASLYKAASGSGSSSGSSGSSGSRGSSGSSGSSGGSSGNSSGSSGSISTGNPSADGFLAGLAGLGQSGSGGSQNPSSTPTTAQTGTVSTNSKSLNMRSGAGAGNSVVASIPKGAKVTVLGESNGWYKVQYNGKTGYVSSQYLTVDGKGAGSSSGGYGEPQLVSDVETLIANGAARSEIARLLEDAYADGLLDEGRYDTLYGKYVDYYRYE